MSRRRHVHAIAELVLASLDAAEPQLSRRLLQPQLGWVAQELDDATATRLGVLELVERCRDEHLASLDADDGLVVLSVSWREIVLRADGVLARRRAGACSRCGARLARNAHRCRRCRLGVEGRATRL